MPMTPADSSQTAVSGRRNTDSYRNTAVFPAQRRMAGPPQPGVGCRAFGHDRASGYRGNDRGGVHGRLLSGRTIDLVSAEIFLRNVLEIYLQICLQMLGKAEYSP